MPGAGKAGRVALACAVGGHGLPSNVLGSLARRPNLTVLTRTRACELLFDGGRVLGAPVMAVAWIAADLILEQ